MCPYWFARSPPSEFVALVAVPFAMRVTGTPLKARKAFERDQPPSSSFRNTFDWHEFSLAVNITYKLNYYFRKPTTNYSTLLSTGTGYTDYDARWQKQGDEQHTNVPSFIYPDNSQRDQFYHYASINVEKADNVKLNDIYLKLK